MNASRAVPYIAALCVLAAPVCGQSPTTAPASQPLDQAARASNTFGLALYPHLTSQPGNLFFSPFSLESALAMTYAGARGQTAAQMADVLHLPAGQVAAHRTLGRLTRTLSTPPADAGYRLNVANALWVGEPLLPAYTSFVQEIYGASAYPLPADPQQAAKDINTWVAQQTHDMIEELVTAGALNGRGPGGLVLTNAIYFKGTWASPFDPKQTKQAPFRVDDKTTVQVPMMWQSGQFRYLQTESFQVLELPYIGKQLSMIVLLPGKAESADPAAGKPAETISSALLTLEPDALVSHLAQLDTAKPRQVSVLLPKFKLDTSYELAKPLVAMGMRDAFSGQADFSGMTNDGGLPITNVIHKAVVDVNEEGTEAAAGSAVIMLRSARQTLPFRADHPFLFVIRHNPSGTILFLGRLVNPKA